jgi:hypothetical protein
LGGTATFPWLLGSDLPSIRSFSDSDGHHESENLSNRDMTENVNTTGVEHTVIQCFTNSSRKAAPPDFGLPPFLGALSDGGCVKDGVLRTSYFWRYHIYYRINIICIYLYYV